MKKINIENTDNETGKLKTTRRGFIRLTSAGLTAMTLTSACKHTVIRKVLSYTADHRQALPGEKKQISSSCNLCSNYCPVLINTYENRPVLIEPNPFPSCPNGLICKKGISALFEYYSQHRNNVPLIQGKPFATHKVLEYLKSIVIQSATNKRPFYLVTPAIASPSGTALLKELKAKYPHIRHVIYDLNRNAAIEHVIEKMTGVSALPVYHMAKASIIISFEEDFLSHPEIAQNYFRGRDVETRYDISFHLQIESYLTPSGSAADQRLSLSLPEQYRFLSQLINEVKKLMNAGISSFSEDVQQPESFIIRLARRLTENKGKSIIVSSSQCYDFQYLIFYLNHLLGNFNRTINFVSNDSLFLSPDIYFSEFLQEIKSDQHPVVFLGGCHDSAIAFLEDLNVSVIRLGIFGQPHDRKTELFIPEKMFPERWEDFYHLSGFTSFCQPVVECRKDFLQLQDILLYLTDNQLDYYEYLKNFYRKHPELAKTESDFDLLWQQTLQRGVMEQSPVYLSPEQYNTIDVEKILARPEIPAKDNILLIFNEKNQNRQHNPVLNEFSFLPAGVLNNDVVYVSPDTARQHQLKDGDYIDIISGNNYLKAIVSCDKNTAPGSWIMELNYSPENQYKLFRLLKFRQNETEYVLTQFIIRKTGESGKIIRSNQLVKPENIQIPEYELKEYLTLERQQDEISRAYHEKYKYSPQWTLLVDLNKCSGCENCVVACMTENNIPYTGLDEITQNRRLNWIRIEKIVHQEAGGLITYLPVMCQQCENAPCERVCPVGASSHSQEGLNQQNYERCIGARYCNNNCPYLARKFNYYHYAGRAVRQNPKYRLLLNPEVSVREKGVTEKCTLCIQRIQDGKRKSRLNNELITDGYIRTACETVCPNGAISFGNLADPSSKVYRLSRSKRAFRLMAEKGTRPMVVYLAKIRNSGFLTKFPDETES